MKRSQPKPPELFVALVVAVETEHFSDDDDICLAAGNYMCARLEEHLVRKGHTVEPWIRGGCEEDWGVYFESRQDEETFQYEICFFPYYTDDGLGQMIVQYHLKTPLLRRIFMRWLVLSTSHPLHETMEEFGRTFSSSRLLTQAQFEEEY